MEKKILSATPDTKQGHGRFVYVVAIVSALGGLLFGYDTGVISGAVLFIEQDYALSNLLVGIVVSAVLIGAVIGAAVGGYLADLVGRRKMIIVAALLAPIQGWRYMLGLAAIPAVILALGMLPLPDTPRWLVNHNEPEKARVVLKRIRGSGDAEKELGEIQKSLKEQKGGRAELLNPLVKPALIIGVALAIFQQVTGINTVIYYAPKIFQFAGISSSSAAISSTLLVGVVNVVFTVVAIILLDRVGRRPLLLVGLAGMVSSLTLLGVSFYVSSLFALQGTLATVGLMVYVASFAIGLGPVFWLLISEIYPLRVRGLAMSIASEANWGSNLIIALTFLTFIQLLGRSGTFWLYAVVGVLAWIFCYKLVPETKGHTLEEIESHWRAGKHPREMGKR
jgi:SP family galactose:H+ symporter-like MFS transporter